MTAAREGSEFVEVLGHPTTKAREGSEFVEVLAHPTTRVRAASVFVEILVGPGGPFPLRLRQRGDNLNSPRLPRFSDSRQRSARVGGDTYF